MVFQGFDVLICLKTPAVKHHVAVGTRTMSKSMESKSLRHKISKRRTGHDGTKLAEWWSYDLGVPWCTPIVGNHIGNNIAWTQQHWCFSKLGTNNVMNSCLWMTGFSGFGVFYFSDNPYVGDILNMNMLEPIGPSWISPICTNIQPMLWILVGHMMVIDRFGSRDPTFHEALGLIGSSGHSFRVGKYSIFNPEILDLAA